MKRNLEAFTQGDFSRGAPSWKEALWVVVKCLFFTTALPFPSSLRAVLLRAFGARIGHSLTIRSRVDIHFPWKLTIGDNVWIGDGARILSLASVEIGSNVCISQEVFLCTGSHDYRKESFDLITKPIHIADGAWLSARVFIAPGVSIGAESVISAGAIVFHDVPENVLVRGNPAIVVRKLSDS
ncbi:MAG: WcaF family extracellular polysaccharide biosynthesis acetyltransferase [Chthoniobacterales bacterium]